MNRDMLENKVLRYIRRVINTHKVVSFDFQIKQDITGNEYGRIDWNVIEENAPEYIPYTQKDDIQLKKFRFKNEKHDLKLVVLNQGYLGITYAHFDKVLFMEYDEFLAKCIHLDNTPAGKQCPLS